MRDLVAARRAASSTPRLSAAPTSPRYPGVTACDFPAESGATCAGGNDGSGVGTGAGAEAISDEKGERTVFGGEDGGASSTMDAEDGLCLGWVENGLVDITVEHSSSGSFLEEGVLGMAGVAMNVLGVQGRGCLLNVVEVFTHLPSIGGKFMCVRAHQFVCKHADVRTGRRGAASLSLSLSLMRPSAAHHFTPLYTTPLYVCACRCHRRI